MRKFGSKTNPIHVLRAGRSSLRDVILRRAEIGLSLGTLIGLGVLSALAGLGQAGLVVVVVRLATALTAGTQELSGQIGPLSAEDLGRGDLLWIGVALLIGLAITEVAASAAQARLYATSIRATQRNLLFAFSSSSFAAQTKTDRGDTQQLLHVHSGQVGALVSAIGGGVSAAANFLILVIAALVLSPVAAIAVLGGLAVMLAVLRPLLTKSKTHGESRARRQRAMASRLSERLELNREIRSFGAEAASDAPILDEIDQVAATFQRLRFIARMNSVAYRLGAFALILAMLAAIDATGSTSLTALTGALLMLLRSLSYGQATQNALQSINEAVPVFSQLMVELDRFRAEERPTRTGVLPARLGNIQLENVSFRYDDLRPDGSAELNLSDESSLNEVHALDSVDLSIDRGQFVAIVGPSGSGKSTLMSILLGLHKPTSGRLLVDGVDLANVDSQWWHERVGFVPQEPKLSSGTVLEAIRFGRPNISDASIHRAAAAARIADEIAAWPRGWDTQVGVLGAQLSGGQRQRIAIARAIAGGPELLLLDEPTSALDEQSEALIGETMDALRATTTIVAIAHRPRTIEHADRIVRVVDGKIHVPSNHELSNLPSTDLDIRKLSARP